MIPLAAIAAAPQIIQGIGGLLGIGKGNRRAKNNNFPVEQVNPLLQKNVAIAENMARTGLPQEQYNNQLNNISRNQAGALMSFGRRAGNTGSLASIVRAGNDATNNLVSQDARARMNNERFAFGQRAQLAGEQNRVWDWNNRQRYIQNANSNAQQIGAGKQNVMNAFTGLSQLGQIAMANGGFPQQQQNPNFEQNRGFFKRLLRGRNGDYIGGYAEMSGITPNNTLQGSI